MITKSLEIFRKNETTYGVVLKAERKFQKLNKALKSYPLDARMKRGEEVLFWVPADRVEEVRRILGLKRWPTSV